MDKENRFREYDSIDKEYGQYLQSIEEDIISKIKSQIF